MPGVKAKHYRRPGGVIALPREMVRSPAYHSLSLAARCLIVVLQDVWEPSTPVVHYSVRRAAEALGVSQATACRAFSELLRAGFIVLVQESDWLNGQAREYRLSWNSVNGREPTDDWRDASAKKIRVSPEKRSDPKPFHQRSGHAKATAQNRFRATEKQ